MLLRAHDVLTQTVLAEWQPFAVSWEESYNAPGTLSATVKLADWLGDPGIGPLRTALQLIADDGSISWTGLVWKADADLTRKVVTLAAAGWSSLLRRRVNRTDLTFTSTDQAVIAAALVNEAQRDTQAGGSNHRTLHISTASVGTTGVTRSKSYLAAERKNIGAALEELANLANGFRFTITDELTTGTAWVRRLNIHPATSATTTVLMAGANVEVAKVSITAEAMVSDADFLAGRERTPTVMVAPVGGYPGMDDVTSAQDVTDAGSISAFLTRRLADGSEPLYLPEVAIPPADAGEVSVNVGDEVTVVVAELGLTEPMVVDTISRQADGAGITTKLKLSRLGL